MRKRSIGIWMNQGRSLLLVKKDVKLVHLQLKENAFHATMKNIYIIWNV